MHSQPWVSVLAEQFWSREKAFLTVKGRFDKKNRSGLGGGGISVTPVIFPSLIDLVTNSVSVIRDSCSVQTVFYVVLCRYVSD